MCWRPISQIVRRVSALGAGHPAVLGGIPAFGAIASLPARSVLSLCSPMIEFRRGNAREPLEQNLQLSQGCRRAG